MNTEKSEVALSEKVFVRLLVLVPLLVATGFFVYVGVRHARLDMDSLQGPRPEVGQPAPDFSFPDLQGRKVVLSSLRGKVVLVNILATWCPTCTDEMPSLQRLHENFEKEDLKVLSLSIDVLGSQVVEPYMRKYRLNFPALLDARGTIKQMYATTGVPETFIIDRNGLLVHKVIGPRNWMDPEMVAFLRRVVERS